MMLLPSPLLLPKNIMGAKLIILKKFMILYWCIAATGLLLPSFGGGRLLVQANAATIKPPASVTVSEDNATVAAKKDSLNDGKVYVAVKQLELARQCERTCLVSCTLVPAEDYTEHFGNNKPSPRNGILTADSSSNGVIMVNNAEANKSASIKPETTTTQAPPSLIKEEKESAAGAAKKEEDAVKNRENAVNHNQEKEEHMLLDEDQEHEIFMNKDQHDLHYNNTKKKFEATSRKNGGGIEYPAFIDPTKHKNEKGIRVGKRKRKRLERPLRPAKIPRRQPAAELDDYNAEYADYDNLRSSRSSSFLSSDPTNADADDKDLKFVEKPSFKAGKTASSFKSHELGSQIIQKGGSSSSATGPASQKDQRQIVLEPTIRVEQSKNQTVNIKPLYVYECRPFSYRYSVFFPILTLVILLLLIIPIAIIWICWFRHRKSNYVAKSGSVTGVGRTIGPDFRTTAEIRAEQEADKRLKGTSAGDVKSNNNNKGGRQAGHQHKKSTQQPENLSSGQTESATNNNNNVSNVRRIPQNSAAATPQITAQQQQQQQNPTPATPAATHSSNDTATVTPRTYSNIENVNIVSQTISRRALQTHPNNNRRRNGTATKAFQKNDNNNNNKEINNNHSNFEGAADNNNHQQYVRNMDFIVRSSSPGRGRKAGSFKVDDRIKLGRHIANPLEPAYMTMHNLNPDQLLPKDDLPRNQIDEHKSDQKNVPANGVNPAVENPPEPKMTKKSHQFKVDERIKLGRHIANPNQTYMTLGQLKNDELLPLDQKFKVDSRIKRGRHIADPNQAEYLTMGGLRENDLLPMDGSGMITDINNDILGAAAGGERDRMPTDLPSDKPSKQSA